MKWKRPHALITKKKTVTLIAILLLSSLGALLAGHHTSDPGSSISPTAARIYYNSHAPISIDTNAGFNNTLYPSNGVISGNGSASNPYIIATWEIDATGNQNAISISSSDLYFMIVNCYLHHANNRGIYLSSVINGLLDNNTCSYNQYGIVLANSCSNNKLFNNTCSYNTFYGISSSSSSSNTLFNNTCSYNTDTGIYLYTSGSLGSNTLSNNNCSNNQYGIYLYSSSSNNIFKNNCSNNINGMYLWSSSSNNFCNNTCSNNSGRGFYIANAGSSSNRIWNNTFYHNNGAGDTYDPSHIQAYDAGVNWWNTSDLTHNYGNYWSDWIGRDFDGDGIQDSPYVLAGSGGTHQDCYPLARSGEILIPEGGLLIMVALMGVAFLLMQIRNRRKRKDI